MKFVDRIEEMERLDFLAASKEGGLAILYGRRRIGKTRLLLEWSEKHGGLYTVSDQSSAEIQRNYFAQAVSGRLKGFADVAYRDWQSLLDRLAQEAQREKWRGPVIFDEMPYLVISAPEFPSILQRWIDHQAKSARLIVAVAGSSQRMMQGLVLSGNAPLYGRAREIMELKPIDASYIPEIFKLSNGSEVAQCYAAWGGVPRYWELASQIAAGSTRRQIERLALDPLGPLHREPDRLLTEEVPSAMEVRPVLDAIGAGAHRVSEIAARAGRKATSMSRPLDRLQGMGLVKREIPFGEAEKTCRRGLYKIEDPFFRLWFRVVSPNRGQLASGTRQTRLKLLDPFWSRLCGQAWEDLCRHQLPRLDPSTEGEKAGPWEPAFRWWKGGMAEWDLVSQSMDGRRLLLGEAKWKARPFNRKALERAVRQLEAKPPPALPAKFASRETELALFVPEVEGGTPTKIGKCSVMTWQDLLVTRSRQQRAQTGSKG